jgi:hypothetical protein
MDRGCIEQREEKEDKELRLAREWTREGAFAERVREGTLISRAGEVFSLLYHLYMTAIHMTDRQAQTV